MAIFSPENSSESPLVSEAKEVLAKEGEFVLPEYCTEEEAAAIFKATEKPTPFSYSSLFERPLNEALALLFVTIKK